MQQAGGGAVDLFSQGMQPLTMENYKPLFEQAYEKPAQQFLQQKALPMVQESMAGEGSRESSALNQAMAQAAADVSTQIGGQAGQFFQGQQQNQNQLLTTLMTVMNSPEFQPYLQENMGWLPMLLQLQGNTMQGGAKAMTGGF